MRQAIFIKTFVGRRVLVPCVALALLGCGDASQEAGMNKEQPWWQDSYDRLQEAKRQQILELMKTHPYYRRPPQDPSIHMTGIEGKVALVDEITGDRLIIYSSHRDENVILYRFETESGEFISFFKAQVIYGYPDKIDFVPYRLFEITENANPSPKAIEARKRISPERFAQFLASDRQYTDEPEVQFIVIHAPLEPGEVLL